MDLTSRWLGYNTDVWSVWTHTHRAKWVKGDPWSLFTERERARRKGVDSLPSYCIGRRVPPTNPDRVALPVVSRRYAVGDKTTERSWTLFHVSLVQRGRVRRTRRGKDRQTLEVGRLPNPLRRRRGDVVKEGSWVTTGVAAVPGHSLSKSRPLTHPTA